MKKKKVDDKLKYKRDKDMKIK